jgi:hypothetical protein
VRVERTDRGGRPTEPRGGERRRGGSLGFEGGGTARERRRFGAVGGSAGGAGGGEESGAVSEIRQAHLSARVEGGGAPVVLPGRTPRGQNHGWSVALTRFLGVEIDGYVFEKNYTCMLSHE